MSAAGESRRPRRAGRIVGGALAGLLVVVVLIGVVFLAWAHTLFMGERPAALDAWRDDAVEIRSIGPGPADGFMITPSEPSGDGLVFLPGARVDPAAYLWKLSGVAEASGLTIVVPKLALNLAFFDTRPIEAYTAYAPEVSNWYAGGHSLGGVRACQLAGADGAAEAGVVGVILFGSYCANDLSDSGLTALTLAGEFDGLSTPEDIEASAGNLPDDAVTVLLEGVNHASFGDYGPQPGDGTATVDSDTARDEIATAVADALAD
ncbi:alpha/beta hydrolase [Agromyces sp. MMS24-JH15]|uniref:alpha/beta hydrolase n=1 Tax=Agromyces sp. MMS24-JH15 TaxID=3243765 RepID=UPI00374896DC